MLLNIRADREIIRPAEILTWPERMKTLAKVWQRYRIKGVLKAYESKEPRASARGIRNQILADSELSLHGDDTVYNS